MEYLDLRVASIDDMLTNAADRSSGCAGYTAIYLSSCSSGKWKEEYALYLPLLGSCASSRSEKSTTSWPNDPSNNAIQKPDALSLFGEKQGFQI